MLNLSNIFIVFDAQIFLAYSLSLYTKTSNRIPANSKIEENILVIATKSPANSSKLSAGQVTTRRLTYILSHHLGFLQVQHKY